MNTNPVVVRMTFARDSDWGKFLKGIRGNLDTGRKCGLIQQDECDTLSAYLEEQCRVLEERGVFKGDAIYYCIQGESTRLVFFDTEGAALFDFTQIDSGRANATRAGYFCKESKFRKKLIKSLFESK